MSSSSPSVVNLVGESAAKKAVADLLRFIGEDPNREGLLDTPARVERRSS